MTVKNLRAIDIEAHAWSTLASPTNNGSTRSPRPESRVRTILHWIVIAIVLMAAGPLVCFIATSRGVI
jgi:hypothetical protein